MTDLGLPLPPLADVQALLAQRSLGNFIRLSWPYVDPSEFLSNWHIDLIAEHLTAVNTGDIRNLIVNIPPRSLKSITTAVDWPAWTWLQPKTAPLTGPGVRFLFSSYAATLALRDSTKCRRLIEHTWYQGLLRRQHQYWTMQEDQNTKTKFENVIGGYRLSTSTEGALTGEGGDILVVDDPHNAAEVQSEVMLQGVIDWWDFAMSTRLNDMRTGARVVIMQRLHHRDLTGHILAKNHGEWVHLCLPLKYEVNHPHVCPDDIRRTEGELLHPERVSEVSAAQLASDLGQYGAAGQLQQRPAPQEGGLFKRSWFKLVGAVPTGCRSVRGWDLAASDTLATPNPDWTYSIRLWKDREGNFYLGKARQFREQGMVVERAVLQDAKAEGKSIAIAIPQDPGQAGKAQAKDFIRKLAGWVIYTNTMTGSKEARATPWKLQAEAGNFHLLQEGSRETDSWIEPFLDSVSVFPNGDHDDDVDAVSIAFEAMHSGMPIPVAVPVSIGLVSPYEI